MGTGCANFRETVDDLTAGLKQDAQEIQDQLKVTARILVADAMQRFRDEAPEITKNVLDAAAEKAPDIIKAILDKNKDAAIAALRDVGATAKNEVIALATGTWDGLKSKLGEAADARLEEIVAAGVPPELIARLADSPTMSDVAEFVAEGKEGGLGNSEIILGLLALLTTGGGAGALLRKGRTKEYSAHNTKIEALLEKIVTNGSGSA